MFKILLDDQVRIHALDRCNPARNRGNRLARRAQHLDITVQILFVSTHKIMIGLLSKIIGKLANISHVGIECVRGSLFIVFEIFFIEIFFFFFQHFDVSQAEHLSYITN